MTLLGGMGTFAGPVIGAFTIIGLQNFLADQVGSWINVIIGAIFVVCVVAFRARLRRRAAAPGSCAARGVDRHRLRATIDSPVEESPQ